MDDRTALDAGERRLVELIFRIGLSISILLMTAGLIIGWVSGASATKAVDMGHLSDASRDGALMAIGIGILATTPAANVIALMWVWARHHEIRLAMTAATVLLTLLVAVVLGAR